MISYAIHNHIWATDKHGPLVYSKAIITRFNIRQQKVDAMLITSHLGK